MIKKYNIDNKLRGKILRTQYKKHPKWKKRRKVRIILWFISIILGVALSYPIFGRNHYSNQENIRTFIMFSATFTILFSAIPIVYYKYLKEECLDVLVYRLNETIVLTDDEIQEAYLYDKETNPNAYDGYDIPYNCINRIIYNKYHQRIDIIGRNKSVCYKDYFRGEVDYRRKNKKETSKVRIYLYFNDNEDLIKTISERSKITIETINLSEE